MKRQKLNKSRDRKVFKKTAAPHGRNTVNFVARGGGRF